GLAGYGLLTFALTLLLIPNCFEPGFAAAASRELSVLAEQPHPGRRMRRLVHVLQLFYWAGAVVPAAVVFLAPVIASDWIQFEDLSPDEVVTAIRVVGGVILLQWPANFYSVALAGLHRQVELNLVLVAAAVLRYPGLVALLWLVGGTV